MLDILDRLDRHYALDFVVASNGKKRPNIEPVNRPGMKKPKPRILTVVDEETGQEVESERGRGARANRKAAELLARMRPGGEGLAQVLDFKVATSQEHKPGETPIP